MTTAATAGPSSETGSFPAALLQFFRNKLKELGVTTRFFLEVMEDGQAGIAARTMAGGVVLYLKHARDLIPDRYRIVGLIDDIIVMTIGMSICMESMPPERRAHYRAAYPAAKAIQDDIERLKRYLALIWDRLLGYVRTLSERRYRDQPMDAVVDDPVLRESLRDETMEYLAKVAIDPVMLDDEFKKLPRLDRIAGLLTDTLYEGDGGDSSSVDNPDVGWSRLKRILRR